MISTTVRTQEKVAKFTATQQQSAVHQRLTKSDNVPVQFVLGTDSFSRWMIIAANVRYRLSDCWGIAGSICLWNVNPLFTMIHDSRYPINCISERDESKSTQYLTDDENLLRLDGQHVYQLDICLSYVKLRITVGLYYDYFTYDNWNKVSTRYKVLESL